MEVKELMVGNLLKKRQMIVTIDTIRRKKEYYVNQHKLEDLQPIPLTEEWLLKFGFENDGSYWRPKDCWHRYVFHQRAFFTNVLNLEPEGGIVPHAQVYYVHQLQNLYFALTGKELTIKN